MSKMEDRLVLNAQSDRSADGYSAIRLRSGLHELEVKSLDMATSCLDACEMRAP